MSLTFADDAARDKLRKLKTQAAILLEEMSQEGFIRFADHAWHLRDWVLNDPRVPQAAKDEIHSWRRQPPILELCICRDIINADKHSQVSRYTTSAVHAKADHGAGLGRCGCGMAGIGEEEITLTMRDGKTVDGLDVIPAVELFWDEFFQRHGI